MDSDKVLWYVGREMTTEFGPEGEVALFTLYAPPDVPIEATIAPLLPAGKTPERTLLISSGGLEIEMASGETPRQALERWKGTP